MPTARVSVARRMLPIAVSTAFLAVALLGILVPAAAAPVPPYFGPSVQVDRIPAYTGVNPSIAVGSDRVAYLAFGGWAGTTTQTDIFFTKSSDGRTWSMPVRVNNDAGGNAQFDPSIALDASNNILIVWTDTRLGSNDIFFSKSTDGGLSFSANVRVNDVTGNGQTEADLAVDHADPDLIHAVWTDTRSFVNGPDIYYANSTDGGLSFNPSLRVNNDATGAEQGTPAIAVASNRDVYIVWSDPRNGARGRDIYFSKSMDLGATWTPNIIVNDDSGAFNQQDPTLAVDAAGTVYVAWTDSRTSNTAPDIWATRSTNGGSSFAANVKVNDDTGPVTQATPNLATNAGKVMIAWSDLRNLGSTVWDVYASSSTDGLSWSPNMKVNDETFASSQVMPSIGIDGSGDVFGAWLDTRASGQDIFAGVLDVIAPTADAGGALSGDQGASIAFDGTGSTDNFGIASYAWEFGDGTSASAPSPTHSYPGAGVFTATLTVWDYSGNSATSSTIVSVRDTEAPVAFGGADRTVDEGQPLFFDASASTDNLGVVAYSWNFGDGSVVNTSTANHVYARPGTYDAKLTVTDAAGNAVTVNFTVTVRPNALLGLIQILAAVIAVLGIALAIVGWMLLGMRKRDRSPPRTKPVETGSPFPPPPRDPDPLDMTLPPAPPKGP